MIATAVRVARLTGGGERAVDETLRGVGRFAEQGPAGSGVRASAQPWIPQLQSADPALDDLVRRIRASGGIDAASVLVTGPNGAGKTAYLRQIAHAFDLNTLEVEAPEIASETLAKTKGRILEIVRQARNAGAFLLLDNVDVLLADMERNGNAWTAVVARELVEAAASLAVPLGLALREANGERGEFERRVLATVRCGPLSEAGRETAFQRLFGHAVDGRFTDPHLTIGDFLLASRRARFAGISDVHGLLRLLKEIGESRERANLPVGFQSRRNAG